MGYNQDGNRRGVGIAIILIVVVFLVIGGAAAVFIVTQGILGPGGGEPPTVGETEQDGTPVVDEPTPVPATVIAVAARDIPRGTRIEPQDVATAPYPVSQELPLPPGAIELTDDEDNAGLSQVVGQVARTDIFTNEPILTFELASPDETLDLADQGSDAALSIPPGRVAMAIPIDRFSGVGFGLRPGDTIDIIMSLLIVDIDEDFQTILPNNRQVLIFVAEENTLTAVEYVDGRETLDDFEGNEVLEVPSEDQRPRRGSQLMVDNALVLNVGEYDIVDLYQPLVLAPRVEAEEEEADEGEEAEEGTVGEELEEEEEATPAPAIIIPDMVIIAIPRQDAVLLDFAIESGINMNVVLRSAFDDDIPDVSTETVTLESLIEIYGFTEPPRIGVGIAGEDGSPPAPTDPNGGGEGGEEGEGN